MIFIRVIRVVRGRPSQLGSVAAAPGGATTKSGGGSQSLASYLKASVKRSIRELAPPPC